MILIGAAKLFSYMLIVAQVPTIVSNMIFTFTDNKLVVLLLINIFMLIIGMFVEANAALLIFVPILFPLCVNMGIDPVHLGVILVFNLCLGVVTPPVGLCLNLASKIAKCSLQESVMASRPFFIVGAIILLMITYIPTIVLFLPNLF
jgi:C4-dicarboxylate transporter DctM subunit